MNRKISDKDKKDWDEFISSEYHLPDKDLDLNKKKINSIVKKYDIIIHLAAIEDQKFLAKYPNKSFDINDIKITPISYMHANLQVYGFRIGDFAYVTDLKAIDNQEIEKLKNLEVLVLNAIRIEEHFSHLNLKEALDLISLIKPKKYFLLISAIF